MNTLKYNSKKTIFLRILAFVLTVFTASAFFTGCGKSEEGLRQAAPTEQAVEFMQPIEVEKNPIATFKIKGYGTINIELYPDKAPNTVCNFIKLIEDGEYETSGIWRNHKGFVVQGGAPGNDATAAAGFGIAGEYAANGYEYNDLSHTEGVVSMARLSTDLDSASQQFFVCLSDACTQLDGQYGAFGKIADEKSMEVIKAIEKKADSNMNNNGALYKKIAFEGASVETFGVDYPEPNRIGK